MLATTRRCLLALSFLVTVLLPSCLDFDAQDVFVHFDPAQDQLDILFVYRGLYADGRGDPNKRIEEAMDHLEEAQKSGAFAFWSNYPWRLRPRHDRTHMQVLGPHLQVENGGLFKDGEGRLCGYQMVRFVKIGKLMEKVNTALTLMVETQILARGNWPLIANRQVDDESRDRLTDFLRARTPILRLRGACLELQLPLSEPDSRWLREQVARSLLRDIFRDVARAQAGKPEAGKPEAAAGVTFEQVTQSAVFRLLAGHDVTFARDGAMTRMALGVPGQPQQILRATSRGEYDPALLKAVEAKKIPVGADVSEEELLARFEAFHKRAASVPEEMASAKK